MMKKRIFGAIFGAAFLLGGFITINQAEAAESYGPNCPDGATICAFDADNKTYHKGNEQELMFAE